MHVEKRQPAVVPLTVGGRLLMASGIFLSFWTGSSPLWFGRIVFLTRERRILLQIQSLQGAALPQKLQAKRLAPEPGCHLREKRVASSSWDSTLCCGMKHQSSFFCLCQGRPQDSEPPMPCLLLLLASICRVGSAVSAPWDLNASL